MRLPSRSPYVASRRQLVLAASLASLALGLRVGLGSMGGLISTVTDALGLSGAQVSVLTTLPSLCFSLAGLAAGRIIVRFGVHQVVVVVSVAGVGGLLLRSVTSVPDIFLGATAVAMLAAAIGNVTLPALTKVHFPGRVNVVTALYSGGLGLSAAVSAIAAVPLAYLAGSWRLALGLWAVIPALAALLWLPRAARDFRLRELPVGLPVAGSAGAPSLLAVARTPLAWGLALCFGCQAGQAYVQFGYWAELTVGAGGTSAHAGQLIAAMNLTVIPMALCMPLLMRWAGQSAVLPIGFAALTVAAYLGVLVGPGFLSGWLWAALLGLGGGAFTWVFTMVGRRTRTPAATAQLAAFCQGGGYLVASGVTVLFGAVHGATGGWAIPIATVMLIAVGIGVFGWAVTRSGDLEHYLDRPAAESDQTARDAPRPRAAQSSGDALRHGMQHGCAGIDPVLDVNPRSTP